MSVTDVVAVVAVALSIANFFYTSRKASHEVKVIDADAVLKKVTAEDTVVKMLERRVDDMRKDLNELQHEHKVLKSEHYRTDRALWFLVTNKDVQRIFPSHIATAVSIRRGETDGGKALIDWGMFPTGNE